VPGRPWYSGGPQLSRGGAHGGRRAAVAARVGLSGRAAVVAPDESSAARARKAAEDAGVLGGFVDGHAKGINAYQALEQDVFDFNTASNIVSAGTNWPAKAQIEAYMHQIPEWE